MACTLACTSFFTKALFCQNKDHFDIPTSIPTIGLDPVVDTCLCVQGNVDALHSCASCRATNNITNGDGTWVFLDACNREFPDRKLWLQNSGTSLRPWGIRSRGTGRGRGSRSYHGKDWRQRMTDAMNVYSVILVLSTAVSMCSTILSA